MAFWTYDANSRRYRVTAEGAEVLGQKPGTYVGNARMLEFRENIIAASKERTNALATQLSKGEININQWTLAMRQEVKDTHIQQYLLGHGGRNTMAQSDWGRIGYDVRQQYQYLNKFADDIRAGKFTEQQIAARSRMYMEASSQSFEKAKVSARGMPDLPDYPASGNTVCLTNCKCSWDIRETETEWLCYWRVNTKESCPGCVERAAKWSPYRVPKRLV